MKGQLIVLGFVAASLAAAPPSVDREWSCWRGPDRDGRISFEIPTQWPEKPQRLWSREVGQGHASPVVKGEKIYLHTRRGEDEVVICVGLNDGKEVWEAKRSQDYKPNTDAREHGKAPNATPTLHDGRLYTLGIGGTLVCWDATDGKRLWEYPGKEFARRSPLYGAAASPLVSGEVCIAHLGGPDKGALVAFDRVSGKLRWRWEGDGPGYASLLVAKIGGVRQVITLTQRFCVGVGLDDGRLLWKTSFTTEYDQNIVTPLVYKDTVIISGIDRGVIALRVHRDRESWLVGESWKTRDVSMYMSSPVLSGGRVVGLSHLNKGQFFAIDPTTGRVLWTGPARAGENAALMSAGSVVLTMNDRGVFRALDPTGDRYRELYRVRLTEAPTWAHPIVVGRDILVKDDKRLECWRLRR